VPNVRQVVDDEQEEWIAFCRDYTKVTRRLDRDYVLLDRRIDWHTMDWCRECQEVGHPYHAGLHWGL
jgi:hypothetical protein